MRIWSDASVWLAAKSAWLSYRSALRGRKRPARARHGTCDVLGLGRFELMDLIAGRAGRKYSRRLLRQLCGNGDELAGGDSNSLHAWKLITKFRNGSQCVERSADERSARDVKVSNRDNREARSVDQTWAFGPNMMMAMPRKHTATPTQSLVDGVTLSTSHSQTMATPM